MVTADPSISWTDSSNWRLGNPSFRWKWQDVLLSKTTKKLQLCVVVWDTWMSSVKWADVSSLYYIFCCYLISFLWISRTAVFVVVVVLDLFVHYHYDVIVAMGYASCLTNAQPLPAHRGTALPHTTTPRLAAQANSW